MVARLLVAVGAVGSWGVAVVASVALGAIGSEGLELIAPGGGLASKMSRESGSAAVGVSTVSNKSHDGFVCLNASL